MIGGILLPWSKMKPGEVERVQTDRALVYPHELVRMKVPGEGMELTAFFHSMTNTGMGVGANTAGLDGLLRYEPRWCYLLGRKFLNLDKALEAMGKPDPLTYRRMPGLLVKTNDLLGLLIYKEHIPSTGLRDEWKLRKFRSTVRFVEPEDVPEPYPERVK